MNPGKVFTLACKQGLFVQTANNTKIRKYKDKEAYATQSASA